MNKELNIDLRRCLKAVLRKWWMIVISGLICYFIAYLITSADERKDEYTAEATVYSIIINDRSVLALYADIIKSTKVCEQAADLLKITNLNADKIKEMISVNDNSTSLVLGIRATASDEVLATEVANAVTDSFIEEVNNITANNSVSLLDEATAAELTYNKLLEQLKLRVLVVFAGIVLLCGWIVMSEIFTRKIYSLSDIAADGELEIIGVIPLFDMKGEGGIKAE